MQELDEALFQSAELAFVAGQVIGVDVRDDGDHRLQMQERRIALVGLGDEILPLTETGVRIGTGQAPADDERRVEPALGEHARDEARRRRLPVRARNGDTVTKPHELAEHLGALNDRNALTPRLGDLGIRCGDGAGDDDDVGIAEVLGAMTDADGRTERLEPRHRLAAIHVGASHGVPEVQQDLGDTGHADTADTDEMNLARGAHRLLHARPSASSTHADAKVAAASGRACSRARSAIASNVARSATSVASSPASRAGSRSLSAITRPAPPDAKLAAFFA